MRKPNRWSNGDNELAKVDEAKVKLAKAELAEVELATAELAKVGIRFGDWLVRRGLINRAELFEALTTSFRQELRLGDALVRAGVLPRSVVEAEATHHQCFVVKAARDRTVQFPLGEA